MGEPEEQPGEEPAEQPTEADEPSGAADDELVVDTTVVETEADREERRRISHQAAIEAAAPRPEPEEVEPPATLPWGRRLEIGGSYAMVFRPFANGLTPSSIGYNPALAAWALHLHWDLFPFLRFHPYFLDAHHGLDIPAGALSSGTSDSIAAGATVADTTVATFVLGAKLAPTWPISDRFRAWIAAGIGWGRYEFPEMVVTEPSGAQLTIRERSGVFVEFPLGLGASFDIIERWLAIEYEATAAPATGQSGSAYEVFKAIDSSGNLKDVGMFGAVEVSFVQTLGLSLIL